MSVLLQVARVVLRLTRKPGNVDVERFRARIAAERRTLGPEALEVPARLRARFDVVTRVVEGRPVHTLRARGRAPHEAGTAPKAYAHGPHEAGTTRRAPAQRPQEPGSAPHVVYLHGGVYVHEIVKEHWHFIEWLLDELGCTVSVPLYPLAPEHGCVEVLRMVRASLDVALESAGDHGARAPLVLMGDSAGGGLALALAQQLRDERDTARTQVHSIAALVLISPWVDVSMTNPAIVEVERRDPWLGIPAAVDGGRMYAKGLDVRDPRVSPLYGSLAGLPPMHVFMGTDDILYPDALALRERAHAQGASLTLVEARGLIHDWPLIALLPEARQTRRELAAVLRTLA